VKLVSTSHFDRNLSKKIRRNLRLNNKVIKQLSLLKKNPKHPSLKLHKLSGKRTEEFSFWIEGNLRIIFQIYKDTIILTDVLTHDEY